MTGWPNLVPVPELYRWLRNEVPGGLVLAPVLAWLGWMVLVVWAGRFLWPVVQPVFAFLGAGVPQVDITAVSIPQIVGGAIASLGLGIFVGYLQGQISNLRHDLDLAQQAQRELERKTRTIVD